ncbi:unnamed protein product, partial [Rotaria sp. Silwood2]
SETIHYPSIALLNMTRNETNRVPINFKTF